ncbi:PrsW family intramembrane metalloprotease [Paeniglutamicibacter antarcticus]|uniref:PrsW family intramembrane metalloprotease n=1 Tax=Arthrobacter terrae TaxID=2935737 RepID=A0A931CSV5_9MICC|nr:PrsW family intramembrane metalloprotease [Arthrobacter terrae]MBG0740274.1 PrsW family intramembrane metalloprotease [Arthrobacter terrae]
MTEPVPSLDPAGPEQQPVDAQPAHTEPELSSGRLPVAVVRPRPQSGLEGSRAFRVLNVVLVALLATVATTTLIYFANALGASVFLICGALALVPLAICLLTLLWIDRWEPEPKSALIFAFCWGAGMSVVASFVVGQWVKPILLAGATLTDPTTVSTLVQAPLVEEASKGLGVLLIFLLRSRTFDGPINGVVYAGTVAAGFAFTENILYFGSAMTDLQQIGPSLVITFVIRGLMSPFAHVMFTAVLGAFVGYAARYGRTWLVICAWLVGLVPAMLLHALWNSSSLIGANFLIIYGALQLPIFILYALGIALLRRSEARLTRRRLTEYADSGWFLPNEIGMLGTSEGRRRAIVWAKTFGGGATMKRFINLATRVAFTRERILLGPQPAQVRQRETVRLEGVLLEGTTAARAALLIQHANKPAHATGPRPVSALNPAELNDDKGGAAESSAHRPG